MNLLVFESQELINQELCLTDRRFVHAKRILKSQPGDRLRVGELGGRIGSGTVQTITDDRLVLNIELDQYPPAPLGVTVVLALPRPKALRRVLRGMTELGVKDIHLIHGLNVEKSYWQSPLVSAQAIHAALVEGLEQSMDTQLPELKVHQRFRPFAEDVLPGMCADMPSYYADTKGKIALPAKPPAPGLLIIGPETGFIPFEETLLQKAGAQSVHLGSRVLRVETALLSALGRWANP